MAFLDNSGDIILDAVLTDTGRMRLARGDGSFKIAKFALGDDEINYSSFNANHPSGSAYFDLEILQTPLLEAFTNNTATMKSKLISLSNKNLLYLPMLVLNKGVTGNPSNVQINTTANLASGSYAVIVDDKTLEEYSESTGANVWGDGVLNGVQSFAEPNNRIRIDQGLHTTEISAEYDLDSSLKETDFIVRMDDRLLSLRHPAKNEHPNWTYRDDDNIATYFVSGDMVTPCESGEKGKGSAVGEVINGPRGNKLEFKLGVPTEINSSTFLFQQIGSELTWDGEVYYFIDTTVQVEGSTTGYRIDVPVRLIKWKELAA